MKTDRIRSGINLANKREVFAKNKGSLKNYPENVRQRIEKKAYELYEKRGGNHGGDWNDWFEAEKMVTSQWNAGNL